MKSPHLGTIVLYAVLADEPAQSFVAAAGLPAGEAVIRPTPSPGGFRAATVVGLAGNGEAGRLTLLVCKQPGDPFRGDADATTQRLADVPYSADGAPGTWTYDEGQAA